MNNIIILVWMHFIADFIFQSDEMAINKSKSFMWLTFHVFMYSIIFGAFGLKFWAITFVTHWITDAITSRINSKLYAANQRHWFFVGIGFDQAIHITTLILTLEYLL